MCVCVWLLLCVFDRDVSVCYYVCMLLLCVFVFFVCCLCLVLFVFDVVGVYVCC